MSYTELLIPLIIFVTISISKQFLLLGNLVIYYRSDRAGKYIYERATKNGKRVQANLGAKNHCVIMEEYYVCFDCFSANKNQTLNQLVGAAFGAVLYL